MSSVVYVCAELQAGQCLTWVAQPDVLESLAITPAQAGAIATAMISVLTLGWVIGEIGRMIKNANNPFAS